MLKKIITTILGYALLPVLLMLNFYTGHYGPIFILNTIYVISILMFSLGIWAVLTQLDSKTIEKASLSFANIPAWKRIMSYAYWVIAGSYFIWQGFFGSAALLLVFIAFYRFYIFTLKEFDAEAASI